MTVRYDGRGYAFDIIAVEGNDLAFTVTATDSAGAGIDLSAATIVATVYNGTDVALDTMTFAVSGDDSEIITLSFTGTEIDALVAPESWALKVTRGGDERTWLAGSFETVAPDRARNSTSGTALTAIVDSDVNVAVTVNAVGGSGGGASTLGDLDDVTITSPVSGNVVSYDGSGWVNSTPAGGGDLLAANNLSDLDDAATARTNLGLGSAATSATTDFATGAEGDLASTAVQPGDLATVATTGDLNDLDDVSITSPANFSTLIYDSGTSTWRDGFVDYFDVTSTPTLGTAAETDATDYATAAQGATADTALQPGDIGTDVQAYDADTLKADTADTLTAGFDSSDYAAGTKSSGTYTPAASDGNFQVATNGGAHTLAPPSTSCSIVIHYTNNGSAGAITTSGFTAVTGDAFTTTDTHEFVCVVTKINDVSVLNVTALQ